MGTPIGRPRSQRSAVVRPAVGALLAGCLLVGLALPASAGSCGDLRSHAGVVLSASGRTLIVERGGGTSSFQPAPNVRVVDEADAGVGGWSGLRSGQSVTVCWAFDDTPRMARIVYVTGKAGGRR